MGELLVVFVNPYYTSGIHDYVAVPVLSGERVELWCDGDKLAEASEPGSNWPEMLARQVAYTADEILSADTHKYGYFVGDARTIPELEYLGIDAADTQESFE